MCAHRKRETMKLLILVSGSHHNDISPEFVVKKLDEYAKGANHLGVSVSVLHGAADGVDAVADEWARSNGFEVASIEADWKKWAGLAGEIRNRKLLDAVLKAKAAGWTVMTMAFPSKRSKGTWSMVKMSREKSILTVINVADHENEDS